MDHTQQEPLLASSTVTPGLAGDDMPTGGTWGANLDLVYPPKFSDEVNEENFFIIFLAAVRMFFNFFYFILLTGSCWAVKRKFLIHIRRVWSCSLVRIFLTFHLNPLYSSFFGPGFVEASHQRMKMSDADTHRYSTEEEFIKEIGPWVCLFVRPRKINGRLVGTSQLVLCWYHRYLRRTVRSMWELHA